MNNKIVILLDSMGMPELDEIVNHIKSKKQHMKKSANVKKLFKSFMKLEDEDKMLFKMMLMKFFSGEYVPESESHETCPTCGKEDCKGNCGEDHPIADGDLDLLEE